MMQISPMILMNLIEQLRLGWPSRGMGFKYICIRACKCAGVRTCLHVHALIYVCISACAYTCIRVLYVRAIVFACMRVCVYFCMSVSFYVFMRPQINRVKFFCTDKHYSCCHSLFTSLAPNNTHIPKTIGSVFYDNCFSSVRTINRQSEIQHGLLMLFNCNIRGPFQRRNVLCCMCVPLYSHACVCVSFYVYVRMSSAHGSVAYSDQN